MARFYGTVQGGRGRATRLGHATSGLSVTAQSYSGDVIVNLCDAEGDDHVHIYVRDHSGGRSKLIYHGPITQLLDQSERKTMLTALVGDILCDKGAA